MKKLVLFLFLINTLAFSQKVNFNFNVKNGEIYFYNDNDTSINRASFYNGKIELDLEKENYNFVFMANSYPRISKSININTQKNIDINFSNKNMIMIKGFLHSDNLGLGGSNISFTNSKNISFNFKSDIYGNFTAFLKKGKYLISTNRFDYKLDPKNQLIYDFDNTKVPYNININMLPIKGFVKGRAVDEKGNSIPYPTFYIKSESKIIKITGNEFGMFEYSGKPGMLIIMSQKNGYIENGKVVSLDKNSSITNIEIPLTRIRASVSGIVTNGIIPLRHVKVILHDKDFNKIEVCKTNENGFYEFYKIPSKSNVFITVMKGNKILYKTRNFPLTDDIEDFNLILN